MRTIFIEVDLAAAPSGSERNRSYNFHDKLQSWTPGMLCPFDASACLARPVEPVSVTFTPLKARDR